MIRCVIIDDEPLAVNVLKDYLETHEVEIVAECNDGFSGDGNVCTGTRTYIQHLHTVLFSK